MVGAGEVGGGGGGEDGIEYGGFGVRTEDTIDYRIVIG